MEREKEPKLKKIPEFFKYLLAIGIIVFISFLFPNNVKFKYQFEKGQTWRYDDLIAPFDFAIRKTGEEINSEIAELEKDFSPYYLVNTEVAKLQKRAFAADFNDQLEEITEEETLQFKDVIRRPGKYLDYGNAFLDRIYDQGVIELAEPQRGKGKDFVIKIVKGNTSEQKTLENLLTLADARELLSDTLPYSRLAEPDFIYPLLENVIVPNLTYNDSITSQFRRDLISVISPSRGLVMKGDLIIPKDGIVTDEIYQKLISFKQQYEQEVTNKQSHLWVTLGYLLLTSLIVGVFFFYLRLFVPKIYREFNKFLFVMMWLVIYSYLVYVVEQTDVLSAYLIPFCIVPIIIKTFYNEQLALFTHISVVLIASFMTSLGYEFTFIQLLAGIVVILSEIDTRDWSRFFYSMLFLFFTYALAFLGLSLIQEGNFEKVDWSVYTWIFINVFLTLLAYPLIPLLERFFAFTSPITLVELSDLNRPLLSELAIKAPGTLQHSLQVANLAEAAARRIGADPLLVKVAALYHDIGKIKNPYYFIENQTGKNPHDDINDLESAQIIIGHVPEGIKMAKKARLPKILIDFIHTHHGTTRAEYFYRQYIKKYPDEKVDESQFRYPGPKPHTKEETILMMADSIEAASKSLKNPTEEMLFKLIDDIIDGKITHGQLQDSEMTFHELESCKEVFKVIQKSVHHVRIEYPEEEKAKPKA